MTSVVLEHLTRRIFKQHLKMTILKSSSRNLSYDEAIAALNTLQTNAITLKKTRKERQRNVHLNIPITKKYLERSGMTMEDLDKIKIVHVSGTKGKGSTCAFCESILRHNGLKTGFYSSPHLVSVTERIRINGEPVDKDKFTSYFWDIFDKVCKDRDEEDRPPYFKFLTLLAFNIFWKEKVDVAVIEVGIGGEYDCTNIIEKPIVTGITSLGLDHTSLLGNTISEIAWHKAGIMKPGVTCYVDPNQKQEALDVISKRGQDIGSSPTLVRTLKEHQWPENAVPKLGLYGEVQKQNASLALALATHFMSVTGGIINNDPLARELDVMETVQVSESTCQGLERTEWPGRSQTVSLSRVNFFLDGAHTQESMESCATWFSEVSTRCQTRFRVLVFNTTGDRDVRTILTPLSSLDIDLVIFCTNISRQSDSVDSQNFNSNFQIQLSRCDTHANVWSELQQVQEKCIPSVSIACYDDAITWVTAHHAPELRQEDFKSPTQKVPKELKSADTLDILVTGSLHLVGGVLGFIS